MPRSRSRSPRRDRHRRRRSRSRSPYGGGSSRRHRSRSPRRRRSRSPPPRKRRSPPSFKSDPPSLPASTSKGFVAPITSQMTLGGSLGVTGKRKKKKANQQLSIAHLEDMTDEDKSMQQIMGFGGFDTTKGKKVKNNDVYAINKKVERKYRQYMNRKGGFNRPLEKVA